MKEEDLPKCCSDFDINPLDLIYPYRLSTAGWDFMIAHGVLDMEIRELCKGGSVLENGFIKIKHRCAKLGDDGLCKIYANRPEICKQFDCATRSDCSCKGKGKCQNSVS